MLRPERLSVVAEPAGDGRSVSGAVKHVIYQGSELRLIVDLADGTEVVANVDTDDDVPDDPAPASRSRCAGRPTRRTCCAAGRRSSAPRRPTSTRCRRRSTAPSSSTVGAAAAAAAPPERRFGRRALIVGGAVAGAAVVVGGVLAVTGDGGGDERRRRRRRRRRRVERRRRHRRLARCASSTGRRTSTRPRTAPSARSTASPRTTGIDVTYSEDFNDNNEVYNRVLAPVLGAGEVIDYDIICPTNWMAARLRSLGWLEPLPLDRIPNRVNLEDRFLNQPWDFGASTACRGRPGSPASPTTRS